MTQTANLKIKMTRKKLQLLLFQKLRGRGVGCNEVEEFARKEVWRGGGRSWRQVEERRKGFIKAMMKMKVRAAMEELEETRRQLQKKLKYITGRWGNYIEVMSGFFRTMQEEVVGEWKDGRDKMKTKINHLERRWVRRRRREWGGGGRPNDDEILSGIRHRDEELRRKAEEEGRELGLVQEPLVYGGIQPTPQEAAVLSLPTKFATFNPINIEEIEVEAELMIAKMKWELQAREERKAGGAEGTGQWTEQWEEKKQREREVYCHDTATMTFANRVVTDIPTCRRTNPPGTLPNSQSVILNNMKSRIVEVSKGYKSDNCDKRGVHNTSNITKEEAIGIKAIKERVREKEWVIMPSDKSGRLTANLQDNYLERLAPHMEGDKIVSQGDLHGIEREMNAHSVQFGRFLRLGERWNANGKHWTRIKSALRTKNCLIPPLYGLPKDHKTVPVEERHLGPPLRPVAGCTESANGALSHMLTEILTEVGDRADVQKFNCLSTEEAMEALTTLNTTVANMDRPVILSMDVVAMYPSFDRDEVAWVVASEFLMSDLEVEVDSEELGLYLAIIYQQRRQELEDRGLDDVVQKRRHPRAKRILMTTDEILNRKEWGGDNNNNSKFFEQERKPNKEEERLMLSLALEEAVKSCMDNHSYSVSNQTRVQARGGPIGLKLSGAVAKVYMVYWCRMFRIILEAATSSIPSFRHHLLKFYVDDQLQVCEELPPGSRYLGGEVVVVDDEVEGDRLIPGDQRTANVLKEIANTISGNTRIEVETPSAHPTGWMPFLDLQLRIASDKSVDWKFYKKSMSSKYFILNRSAVPAKVKRASLAQEGLRRLRNTRPTLLPGEKVRLMEDFAEMLLESGYPEYFRAGILRAALTGYNKQAEADFRGSVPLYRPREWQQEERRRKKLIKKASWYRPADVVLFLPATPDAGLASRIRGVVEEEGRRLGLAARVVERGGTNLKQQLVKTDLGYDGQCPQGDCLLCLTNPGEEGSLKHHRSGALYSGSCVLCPAENGNDFTAVYFGETGDSGYTRTSQHRYLIEKKDRTNAFADHLFEHHRDREGDIHAYRFKVVRTFRKSLVRQIWEAVAIHGSDATIVLNSRSEWEQPSVARVVITRELPERVEGGGGERGRGTGRGRGIGQAGRGRGGAGRGGEGAGRRGEGGARENEERRR